MNPPVDTTLAPGYFDAVYAANADPWSFETSAYESAKYDDTLAALDEARPEAGANAEAEADADAGGRDGAASTAPRRYARAFEIGCSIGVLTARLADRCDRLLAVDVSDAALARARERCAGRPQVEFRRLQVPDEFPDGRFDLVMLSEVGYYWSPADLDRALRRIVDALAPGGTLLMVHWTPPVHDYPQTGDAVHAAALAIGAPLIHRDGRRRENYRLDRFEKADRGAS